MKAALIRSLQAGIIMIAFSLSWMAVDSFFVSGFRLFDSILLSGMCLIIDAICVTGACFINDVFKD